MRFIFLLLTTTITLTVQAQLNKKLSGKTFKVLYTIGLNDTEVHSEHLGNYATITFTETKYQLTLYNVMTAQDEKPQPKEVQTFSYVIDEKTGIITYTTKTGVSKKEKIFLLDENILLFSSFEGEKEYFVRVI